MERMENPPKNNRNKNNISRLWQISNGQLRVFCCAHKSSATKLTFCGDSFFLVSNKWLTRKTKQKGLVFFVSGGGDNAAERCNPNSHGYGVIT